MDIEKLIDAVRIHPVLYDLSHSKYMDAKYKTYIWKNIGKLLGFDGPSCKTRWTNLRDTYRKFLRKAEKNGKKIKVYKYHLQMDFLRPFLSNERDTAQGVDSEISDEFDCGETNLKSEINLVSNKFNQSTVSQSAYQPRPSTSRSMSPREALSPPLSSPTLFDLRKSKRPRRICKSRSSFQPLTTFTMDPLLPANNKPEAHFKDPIDAFLLGAISPILKSLPPYELALAKSELFAIAQKYEFKMANVDRTVLCTSEDQDVITSNVNNAVANINLAISPVVPASEDRGLIMATSLKQNVVKTDV